MKKTFIVSIAIFASIVFSLPARAADMPAPFAPIVEMYRRAIAEHWEEDRDKLEANGIPVEFGYGGKKPEIVASIVEVDGSKVLIIYDEGWRESLCAAYAIKDDEAVRLFTGAGRSRWNLVHGDDGRAIFVNEGSSSAFDGFDLCYTVRDGALSYIFGIVYEDRAEDSQKKYGPWFEMAAEPDLSRPDYWRDGREITDARANDIIDSFTSRRRFPKGDRLKK